MSLFESLFKNSTSENNSKTQWIPLDDEDQLDAILQDSEKKVVLIFKHSTRCGTSMMVKKRFENNYNFNFDLYYLDLIKCRNISNLIAEKLEVKHQSPQLLIIKKGKAIENASHFDILNVNLENYI